MAPSPRCVTAANIAEARRIYENTRVPVDDIAAMLGITRTTFYKRRALWGWKLRFGRIPTEEPPREPDEAGRAEAPAPARGAAPDTPALAARIRRVIESELDAVEAIVATLRPEDGRTDEAERAARALASLARTLHELARLDARREEAARHEEHDEPADPDDFIRDLARRMDEFARREEGPVPDGAASA